MELSNINILQIIYLLLLVRLSTKATHIMRCELLNSNTDIPVTGIRDSISEQDISVNRNYNTGNKIRTGVVTSQYGFLAFASRDDYDYVLSVIGKYDDKELDAWEQSIGFTSAYTAFSYPQQYNVDPADNLNSLFEDEFLLRILDKNGMIQIGNQVFNLEVNYYRLLAINHNHFPYFRDAFINGIFEPQVMNQYNILVDDIDVFEHLDTGVVGFDNYDSGLGQYSEYGNPKDERFGGAGTTGSNPKGDRFGGGLRGHSDQNSGGGGGLKGKSDRFTGGSGKPGTPEDPKIVKTIFTNKSAANDDLKDSAGTIWRADVKVSYQKALVYFSLMAELKYMAGGFPWTQKKTDIWLFRDAASPMPITSTYCMFEPKRRSKSYPSIPHQNYDGRKFDNKLNWRMYEASRGLAAFDLNAVFGYEDNTGVPRQVQVRITK